jgi:uncharacterized protein DUF2786
MNEENVLNKIKKLLTMASRSENEGESQNAMLMAQKLMAKHGIEQSEAERFNQKPVKEVIDLSIEKQIRIIWWKKQLAAVVSDNFRCKVYHYSHQNYDETNDRVRYEVTLRFIGLKEDIQIAQSVYAYAVAEIQYSADRYMKIMRQKFRITPKGLRNDYLRGFITGLRQKFKDQVAENNWQLIVVPDDAVIERVESLGLRRGVQSRIGTAKSSGAYDQGQNDGYNCNLDQQKLTG